MKHLFLFIFLLFCVQINFAQNTSNQKSRTSSTSMVLEGRVLTESGKPISGVNIEGKMGRYTTTDALGRFTLPANMGEEVTIRGLNFETVYYRINTRNDIEIRVQNQEKDAKELSTLSYQVAMDSAQEYLRKDAKKTADFLIAALSNNPKSLTKIQESAAYEKLGDLYLFNEQYDLAVSNYNQAAQLVSNTELVVKKADALRLNGNYQEAITAYKSLDSPSSKKSKSSNNQNTDDLNIRRWTGLGDAYAKTNQGDLALETYKNALQLAQKEQRTQQVTTINSKIAKLLNDLGREDDAEVYFDQAIIESKKESPIVNAQIQSQTADFYNSNSRFDEEIALRKNNIKLLDSIKSRERSDENKAKKQSGTKGFLNSVDKQLQDESEIVVNDLEEESSLEEVVVTPTVEPLKNEVIDGLSKQKEQLKIAEAFKAQNKISDAITYYESSLEEATTNNDLEVKKDAAKNLYELNKKAGNTKKALDYNELYINTVDALYLEKENELEATARRAKELVAKQTRILTLEKDRELTENKLALVNTERELTQEMNQRQRWIIYSLVALSLLLLTLAYFMYRNNKQQKINNHLLALKSLRSQMNPHFIFNALNSVNNYIAQNDERAANKYLADFSKLMRSVLENSELDFMPLEKEIDLLGLYLKLEHERFKDKFDYTLEIDPSLRDTKLKVPPMLLQPIIENAVWHGLRYKEEKGFLDVAFAKAEKGIQVTITDNGIGREKSKAIKTEHQKKRDSKGLGNIKNRVALLNELHDCEIDIKVTDAGLSPDVGTEVVVLMRN
ncbi:hypothetical protein A9Q93_06955 [Nonlabens dokdonensis]|uniref:SpoVT-AbrB domain-containing protein n=1 Tax=Nonlabens dokdonensis TaxID=328515 RepID=A0A1Z8AYT5_9FLAO|nr:histidine kinase [Nonlabens dokdonensis]OUS15477.1 hypothetical protein A9Q93_06955 [Nonlabens dokdonensis]